MKINKLASAVRNDVVSGLRGYHANPSMSMEQLEDEIVLERLQVMKEYSLKGILPTKDLYTSINCIPVDCMSIDRCKCNEKLDCAEPPMAHFEVPLIVNDYGDLAIDYIGATDRQLPFIFYTTSTGFRYHKYRKRGKNKPYVWIDTTPNANNMYDGFIFNAPLLDTLSITAIFKDPRLIEGYGCCTDDDNLSFIDNEVIKRLTQKKLQYYRQAAAPLTPNNLQYLPG